MKAKTKFLKMYYKLPVNAKIGLIYFYEGKTRHPMSLSVCRMEILANTFMGAKILEELGYKDD